MTPNIPLWVPALTDASREVHALAREKGWYDSGQRSIAEHVANIHGEVSELWEEYREHGTQHIESRAPGTMKPIGLAVELADVIIRAMDMAAHMGVDIGSVIYRKHIYNASRPYRHGDKYA